jgi:hypothetical protein
MKLTLQDLRKLIKEEYLKLKENIKPDPTVWNESKLNKKQKWEVGKYVKYKTTKTGQWRKGKLIKGLADGKWETDRGAIVYEKDPDCKLVEVVGSKLNESTRPLSVIAREIRNDWKNVNYAAKPYLDAMSTLTDINSKYGLDSAASIVAYFLGNANSWRGEKAKEIKKELNLMLKTYYKR